MADEKTDLRNLCKQVIERCLRSALQSQYGPDAMAAAVAAAAQAQELYSQLPKVKGVVVDDEPVTEPEPPLGWRWTNTGAAHPSGLDLGCLSGRFSITHSDGRGCAAPEEAVRAVILRAERERNDND